MNRILFRIILTATLVLWGLSGLVFSEQALTKDAAEEALKKVSADVKVVAIEPTPVEGLFEVIVLTRGNIGIAYLDAEARYIFSGAILDISTRNNITTQRMTEANKTYEDLLKIDFSRIPLEGSIVLGDKEAKYKVVVFDDPD